MGSSSWTADTRTAYASRSAKSVNKSRSELFQSRSIRKDFNPKNIVMRESVDSEANPQSTPIIVGLDVTGSMGMIAEHIAKQGLGTLIESIIDTKPVTDPHIMMMAIGDINYDDAPLQVTQFEADITIADQLEDLWLEGGGGGNQFESYDLPWLFAARKTKTDAWDKRGQKGYVFTIGDELPPKATDHKVLNENIGLSEQQNMTTNDMLESAQERYNVFHIIVEEGSYARSRPNIVREQWTDLLGKRAVMLKNYRHLSEVITSVILVQEGGNPEDAIAQWQDKSVRESVEYALNFHK